MSENLDIASEKQKHNFSCRRKKKEKKTLGGSKEKEVGWRGCALDEGQQRARQCGPATSSSLIFVPYFFHTAT